MAPTDPIRPDSVLATDPALAAALAGKLPLLGTAAAAGGKPEKLALANALDTWSLLAACPWQRLNYRYGRWQAEATVWKALLTFDAWESYHWARNDETFQVIDPYGGQRLGEFFTQAPATITAPGGSLEFAGHPGSIGAYRPAGGGADTVRLSWNPWLNNVVLREGIAALRSGAADQLPAPYQFVDLNLLDKYRRWFADQPDKPAGKAPWANEARLYRPGGPARFGT
jgi:hypothetical protein